jgi:hypothetical protein
MMSVRIYEPGALVGRLEAESGRNLDARRPPGSRPPDRKTVAEFRRWSGEALKWVIKGFVKSRVRLRLYEKELAAVDGSEFKAADSKDRNYTQGKLRERIGGFNSRNFF